jgi:hypothetical protein
MASPIELSTPAAFAQAYARLGWHVLPIEPGTKRPLGASVPRGMLDATTDAETIARWWSRDPHAGVGIALAQSGLVAVDVDPRNGGTETFEALQADHGSLRSEVMAFTGGNGEHHVFVVPHGHQVSLPGTLGPGIDLKANGYIVVEPSVHPNGRSYVWEASSSPLDGVAPSPLPDWLRQLRPAPVAAPQQPASTPIDARQLRDAREALYTLNVEDHDSWVKAGMALHSTGWGHSAYAMWCAWSQQSTKFDATEHRNRWASFHTDGDKSIRLSFIFKKAQDAGWNNPGTKLEQVSGPAIPVDGLILTVGQLHDKASAVRWAVKGVIAEQGVGFIYGASGTFKSFLALDYALHRAYGMRWMGRRTKQAVPVYLAAEGGAGIMKRVQAWHLAHQMDWRQCPMRFVLVPLTLRTQASVLRDAVLATGVPCGDLIVDTMSQTFTGNENSNDEVADFLRTIGTDLRDALGATVTIVHHSGHSATERPRGASAIIANVDYAFGVFRDEKEMLCTVEFTKIKDGERPADETFQLTVSELGRDEDGDAITSLSAGHINNAEQLVAVMKSEGKAGRGGRNQQLLALVQNGMHEKELRKAFYDAIETTDPEARKKAFYRAKDWAMASGFFEIAGEDRRIIVLKEIF